MEGARVRTTAPVPSGMRAGVTVPVGTEGTVIEVLTTPREGYHVEFPVGSEDFDYVTVGREQVEVIS